MGWYIGLADVRRHLKTVHGETALRPIDQRDLYRDELENAVARLIPDHRPPQRKKTSKKPPLSQTLRTARKPKTDMTASDDEECEEEEYL